MTTAPCCIGLATGATMKVAVQALRHQRPKKIVVAVPVGATDTCEEIRQLVDELICLVMPEPFYAVGYWYQNFEQLSDTDVIRLLEQAKSGENA
jgi:putative phosphoribosyl transferase